MKEEEKIECCLCGKEIEDFGHNPQPLGEKEDDRCCDECNQKLVIPTRLRLLFSRQEV